VAMANSFRATQNKKIEKVEVLRYHPEDGGWIRKKQIIIYWINNNDSHEQINKQIIWSI
jgi:hypothetical protein